METEMTYSGVMLVDARQAEALERFCHEPPGDCGRGECLFDVEYVFSNGNRMAIQVVASEEPDEEACWTQGVVFDLAGNEIGVTSPGDSFLGEYYVWVHEDEYVVNVITKEKTSGCPTTGSHGTLD